MAQNVCKSCGTELIPGKEFCPKCLLRVPVIPAPPIKKQYPKDIMENRKKKMREYKVAVFEEVMDLGSRGKYDKTKIEEFLNALGLEGWSLKKILTRKIPGLASDTVELIMFFERDLPLAP